jgi:hypothetical protein
LLEVTASHDRLLMAADAARQMVLPQEEVLPISFAGNAGSWNLAARRVGPHRIMASNPMEEDAASRILVLLGGGIIRIGPPNLGLPPIRVPNAGAPGREWFECVRHQLFP